MRSLVLLLTSPEDLLEQSIRLQRVLSEQGEFKINFQDRSYAQFLIETNTCAEHYESALRKLGFNVEVSEEEPTSMEKCHDCHVAA